MKYFKAIFSLIDQEEKRKLYFLCALMIIAALIELVGVGSLFPYINILSHPDLIYSNIYLSKVYHYFSFRSQASFLIFLGSIIFLLIFFKGVITCLNNYAQAKFSARLNNKVAKKILDSYIRMDYAQFVETNTATLSKHLLYDVQNVIGVISSILNMMTSLIVGVALITLMLLADFWAVIASVTLLLFFLQMTAMLTKKRMHRLAKSNETNYRKAYKTASEAFQGIKDIKISGAEKYFANKYNAVRRILSKHLVEYSVISNLPNVVMNVIGFGILMAVLLYLLATKGNMMNVLPIIAIIAICIQRLLPTITVVSTSIGLIRKFKPVVFIVSEAVEKLKSSMTSEDSHDVSKILFNHKISLKSINFQYPGSEELALSNISFDVKKNTTLGIVGSSGAGKSTLVDVLLGIYYPISGGIFCDELEITRDNAEQFRKLIGYVPQKTFLLDGTIKENIAFGIPEADVNQVSLSNAIEIAQLKPLINEMPNGLNTWIGEDGLKLSGGQRQRIGIARALYHNPDIIILDEATNALDSITETEFNASLKSLMHHKTLIIIAHRLSSIEFCDHLLLIDHGRIASFGEYSNMLKDEKFLSLYPSLSIS